MSKFVFGVIYIILFTLIELPYNLSILQLVGYKFFSYVNVKYCGCKFNYIRIGVNIIFGVLQIFFLNCVICYLLWIITYFVLSIIINIKHRVKRYICTNRIIRIFMVYILFALLSQTYVLLTTTYITMSKLYMVLTLYPYFLYFISLIICVIFEYFLLQFYIKNAKKKISKYNVKIIGITGSYGKTSVKNILYDILSVKYNVVMSPKSFNTPGGLCKTINGSDLKGVDYLILEMGADRCGDIKRLCKYFTPEYGILTAIGEQHLKTFKTIENIYKTKCELQGNLCGKKVMVFNCYNDMVNRACVNFNGEKICVGVDVIIENFQTQANGFDCEIIYNKSDTYHASIPLLGYHNAINVSIAVAMALKLNMSHYEISCGLNCIRQIESRMQVVKRENNVTLLNNGYNSNPQTARCSLEVLKGFNIKKVVITPGFVELGKHQFDYNYEFGKEISTICDEVYIVNLTNRDALKCGLSEAGFDMDKVHFVNRFSDIDLSRFNDCVVLIENDLPTNYT